MSVATAPSRTLGHAGATATSAFKALLLRDLTALRKRPTEFIARTLIQPFLLLFVFGYVYPKIGQGPQSQVGADRFATALTAGMLGLVTFFQGIQAVALALVQEFGYTREIEDRVLAPLPISAVAVERVVAGAAQGLMSAVIVFPLAAFVPAGNPSLDVTWSVLLTLAPLAAVTCSSIGLFLGTKFDPRSAPAMFIMVIMPLTFLGCTLYPWTALEPVKIGSWSWLQTIVLLNPLTYVSEGFRAAVTTADHLSLAAVYPVLGAFVTLLLWAGIRGFKGRVLS
jgi:ABC-2 type transport system permease protein